MSLRMPLILVLVLFAATFGFCNPPYGQSGDLTFGNWKLWCKIAIPGVTADGKFVTGTNVQATCTVGHTTPSSGTPIFQFMQLKWAKLEVAGANSNGAVSLAREWTYPDSMTPSAPLPDFEQGGGGTQGQIEFDPPDFRFASTKFTHLSEISLTLTVKFKGWIAEPGGGLTPMDSGPISVTIKPKAYNFFLGWRTQVTSSGGSWGNGQVFVNSVQYALNNMFVGYANHAHHAPNPNYVELHWLKPEIIGKLDEATTIGANTHGFLFGLADSMSWTYPQAGTMTWADMHSVIQARGASGVPAAYNLVLFYACDTLSWLDPAGTFLIAPPARALSGFDKLVWTHGLTAEGDLFTLDKHVIALRQQFVAGSSLTDGLAEVWKKYKTGRFLYDPNGNPDMSSYQPSPMLVTPSSDGLATLVHVYLTGEERDGLTADKNRKFAHWYKFLAAPYEHPY